MSHDDEERRTLQQQDPGFEDDFPDDADFGVPLDEPDFAAEVAEDWEQERLEAGGLDEQPPMGTALEPHYAQPINRATMVCLRGPCIWYWHAVSRYKVLGKEMRLQASHSCLCGPHEAPLSNANVYYCSLWWPQWLAWVPESWRGPLREKLYRFYRRYLERNGYDFAWKTWEDDIFFSDKLELRTDGGIGGKRVRQLNVPLHGPGED